MSGELISIRHASVGYGTTAVLTDVNVEVGAGEVVALLGHNGSGKSTIFDTISGLLPPLGGEVIVLGRPAELTRSAHKMIARGLSHVPGDRALFQRLTVSQHLRLRGKLPAAIERRIFELFPALAPIKSRPAGALSGGERQMLAIARALASQPKVILLDEMSLGLAPLVIEQLALAIRELAVIDEIGVLFVEQHLSVALQLADRAYVISDGTVGPSRTSVELAAENFQFEAIYINSANPPAHGTATPPTPGCFVSASDQTRSST